MVKKPCCSVSRLQTKKTSESENIEITQAVKKMGRAKLIFIPGGTFKMGTEDRDGFPADGEGPVRDVVVDPFL